ncbi:hypothetical protein HA152_07290 [Prochlorococcus marinus XMU1412]|uniref:fructosamine kinase family protein n=1 Tax=Prochlorococcus marinus TaxID=1219 RepID=UPI001ADA2981|nr:fructosamine kinase family protein [Prochlorococcus marinus]MBO8240505.1 hypothetical protein [Prochlorococcus marinus XMU1412]MBW3071739.1 hypothetical protein [Prochlorococcus marinus str. MU1412]
MKKNSREENLNKALNTLKKNNLHIQNYQRILGGANSTCWKLQDKKNLYFLKFYKDYDFKRNRLNNEINFIELLKNENISNVPNILYFNELENWSLFEWIEGNKIIKANEYQWKIYIKFILDLQNLKISNFAKNINNASEACFDIGSHLDLIEDRVNKALTILSKKEIKYIDEWLKKKIINRLQILKKKYFQNTIYSKFSSINNKIISPSDVGFHNIICIKNELFFYDFEYSGWDDPYKLFVDLVIQPEQTLNIKEAFFIIHSLADGFSMEISNEVLHFYIDLYRVKWITIILNKILYEDNLEIKDINNLFTKIKNYYNLVGEIWNI